MPVKVTKEQFIQTIENNEEGLTNLELASKLEISPQYFYDLKKQYKNDIRDIAKEMAEKSAAEQVNNLKRNAKKGDTKASTTLLELADVYIPHSKQDLKYEGDINFTLIDRFIKNGNNKPNKNGTGRESDTT